MGQLIVRTPTLELPVRVRADAMIVAALFACSLPTTRADAVEVEREVVGFAQPWVVPRAGTTRCAGELLGIQEPSAPVWTCLRWSGTTQRFEVAEWGRVPGITGTMHVSGGLAGRAYFQSGDQVVTLDLESMQVVATVTLASAPGESLQVRALLDREGDGQLEALVVHASSREAIHSLSDGAELATVPASLGATKSFAPLDAVPGDELYVAGHPGRFVDPTTFVDVFPPVTEWATTARYLQLDADAEMEAVISRAPSPVGPSTNVLFGFGAPGSELPLDVPFDGGLSSSVARAPWTSAPQFVMVFGSHVVTMDAATGSVVRDETRLGNAGSGIPGSAAIDLFGDADRELVWWQGAATVVHSKDAPPKSVQGADGWFRAVHGAGGHVVTLEVRGGVDGSSVPQFRARNSDTLELAGESWFVILPDCRVVPDLAGSTLVGTLSICSEELHYRSLDGIGQWSQAQNEAGALYAGTAFSVRVPTATNESGAIVARNARTSELLWVRDLGNGTLVPQAGAAGDLDSDGRGEYYVATFESLSTVVRRYDDATSPGSIVFIVPGRVRALEIAGTRGLVVRESGVVSHWSSDGLVGAARDVPGNYEALYVTHGRDPVSGEAAWLLCGDTCRQLRESLDGEIVELPVAANSAVRVAGAWILGNDHSLVRVSVEQPLLVDGFE